MTINHEAPRLGRFSILHYSPPLHQIAFSDELGLQICYALFHLSGVKHVLST